MNKTTLQKTFFALGTVNSITVYDGAHEAALTRAMQRVQILDDRLSVFKPDSEIARVNAAAGGAAVRVHPDTMTLLHMATDLSAETEGAFDISIRPLTALWGIGKKGDYVPSEGEIAQVRQLVDHRDVLLDEARCTVRLRRAGQAIDLGSIAKGYAADEVCRILSAHDVTDAIINLGGTVVTLGEPHMVGIQHPLQPTGVPMGKVEVADLAMVTSGSYEKYFLRDGVRYHHILDPRTGLPSRSGLQSVTILGASAALLDALTTAVFVRGIAEGSQLLERYGLQAVFVTDALDVLTTQGLRDRFSLISGI